VWKFNHRGRRSPPSFCGSLENTAFVLKAQSAYPACVINCKKEVEGVQYRWRNLFLGILCLFSLLPVVAENNFLGPAIRFSIGNDGRKDRSIGSALGELRAAHKGEAWFKREPVIGV
jgi:hypothetical protein